MSDEPFDNGFYRHPKVLALGNSTVARLARDLYIGSLMYSRQHLTDGFIPLQALPDIDPITPLKDVEKAALALHSVGLFKRKRGRFTGYWIPDYENYQQTKQEVESAREAAKARKRRQREAVRNVGNTIDRSLMSQRDTLPGHTVTPSPVTPQEQKQNKKKKNAVTALPLEHDKEIELQRILDACRGTDDESLGVLRSAAHALPLSKIVWVRQSVCMRHGRVGVGYAVNALRSENKEAA